MKASLQELPVIVVHEGRGPWQPTPCPEEPAIGVEAVPAWFVPPLPAKLVLPLLPAKLVPPLPAKLVPPLPATLVCPPLPAPSPFTGSLLVDAHE